GEYLYGAPEAEKREGPLKALAYQRLWPRPRHSDLASLRLQRDRRGQGEGERSLRRQHDFFLARGGRRRGAGARAHRASDGGAFTLARNRSDQRADSRAAADHLDVSLLVGL